MGGGTVTPSIDNPPAPRTRLRLHCYRRACSDPRSWRSHSGSSHPRFRRRPKLHLLPGTPAPRPTSPATKFAGATSGVYPNTVTLGTVTTTTCAAPRHDLRGHFHYATIAAFDTSNQTGTYSSSNFRHSRLSLPLPLPLPHHHHILTRRVGRWGNSGHHHRHQFLSTLTSNTVKFNGGHRFTLSSGTTTQLVAVVPSGATTGQTLCHHLRRHPVNSSSDFTISTPPPSTVYDSTTDFSTSKARSGTTSTATRPRWPPTSLPALPPAASARQRRQHLSHHLQSRSPPWRHCIPLDHARNQAMGVSRRGNSLHLRQFL